MNIDKAILKKVIDSTYGQNPADLTADGYQYLANFSTPTIMPYLNEGLKIIIIGIRGTYDVRDLMADTAFLFNNLQNTRRFKEDKATIEKIQAQYPPPTYRYFGVGHSLGGGLLDQFIKLGSIEEGRSYNPAIQVGDISNIDLSMKNKRIYNDKDALYKLFGRNAPNKEVRQGQSSGFFDSIFAPFPVSGYQYYKHHTISNPVFDGGAFFNHVYLGR